MRARKLHASSGAAACIPANFDRPCSTGRRRDGRRRSIPAEQRTCRMAAAARWGLVTAVPSPVGSRADGGPWPTTTAAANLRTALPTTHSSPPQSAPPPRTSRRRSRYDIRLHCADHAERPRLSARGFAAVWMAASEAGGRLGQHARRPGPRQAMGRARGVLHGRPGLHALWQDYRSHHTRPRCTALAARAPHRQRGYYRSHHTRPPRTGRPAPDHPSALAALPRRRPAPPRIAGAKRSTLLIPNRRGAPVGWSSWQSRTMSSSRRPRISSRPY